MENNGYEILNDYRSRPVNNWLI